MSVCASLSTSLTVIAEDCLRLGVRVTAFLALPSIGKLAAEKLPIFLVHSLTWVRSKAFSGFAVPADSSHLNRQLRQQTADDLFGVVPTLGFEEDLTELETLLTETSWSVYDRSRGCHMN